MPDARGKSSAKKSNQTEHFTSYNFAIMEWVSSVCEYSGNTIWLIKK